MLQSFKGKQKVFTVGRFDPYEYEGEKLGLDFSPRVNHLLISLYNAILLVDIETIRGTLELCPLIIMKEDTYQRLQAFTLAACVSKRNKELTRQIMVFFSERRRIVEFDNSPYSPLIDALNSPYTDDKDCPFLYESSGETVCNIMVTLLSCPNDFDISRALRRLNLVEKKSRHFKLDAYNDAYKMLPTVLTMTKEINKDALIFLDAHSVTPFAETPFWVTEDVVDSHRLILDEATDEELDLYYGPVNSPPLIPDGITEKELRIWRIQYRMLHHFKSWYRRVCSFCHKRISKPCYAARRPEIGSGGWGGCYCSWECVMLSLGDTSTPLERQLVNHFCKYVAEHNVQDISYF